MRSWPIPAATCTPEVRETHSGLVILVGDLGYKVKKPVDLGFLDFRSVAIREATLLKELQLNRRLAPDVYLDVARLNGTDGELLEPVLVMRRMPADRKLATLARHGENVEEELDAVAKLIADFHHNALRGPAINSAAGPAGLRQRWHGNLSEIARFAPRLVDSDELSRIEHLVDRYLHGRGDLFQTRAAQEHLLDGHGDLMAEDIFCLDDGPRVLDCLEFDDRLRWVDRLDDIAFLAMDLQRLGRPEAATFFVDRYVAHSGQQLVPTLLHHYIAYRALVRAKVSCIRAEQEGAVAATEAATLVELAVSHLQLGEVRLVIVGGAPGTGKSTVAAKLAGTIDAEVLSSDRVRRELPMPSGDRYSPAAKSAVYAELLRRAAEALRQGRTVIADATWSSNRDRELARVVAAQTSSTVVEVHCVASMEVAAARAEARRSLGTSESEAGADVSRQLAMEFSSWPQAIELDTTGSWHENLSTIARCDAHER